MGWNILLLIPARGGSKGIPRKNLRPLSGKPLIYYAIRNALGSSYHPDVYVSTDDDEIEFFSKKFGVNIHRRTADLANDAATLDPVIIDAYEYARQEKKREYDFVVTMQPTSPLLRTDSLDAAIQYITENKNIDTVISAIGDAHLTWRKEGDVFLPNYQARVNRQYLPKEYKETGGFLIARSGNLKNLSRIGSNVSLFQLTSEEAIDIDGYNDWSLCDFYLSRKHIVFVVSGYPEIGLGHIYNCLGLANEILNHKVTFIVDKNSELGLNKIRESNYPVVQQQHDDIIDDIQKLMPDLVVNDRLDTDENYVKRLKSLNYKVVNIEDLGPGAKYADIVINAIYPEKEKLKNHYFGASYFCARDEFGFHPAKSINDRVRNILISFGGVDPANLTMKVLESIYDYCQEKQIAIVVVAGLGYENYKSLEKFKNISLYRNVKNISDFFYDADIVFSSAGRTIYELAILGTPTIVLAQNERELTHFYAYEQYGFINLGLGKDVSTERILDQLKSYAGDYGKRKDMSQKMLAQDVMNGKKRVVQLINTLLKDI